jgi:cytochrome bd-type quinol oxidase subunit 1
MTSIDVVSLSRMQFGLTALYHAGGSLLLFS